MINVCVCYLTSMPCAWFLTSTCNRIIKWWYAMIACPQLHDSPSHWPANCKCWSRHWWSNVDKLLLWWANYSSKLSLTTRRDSNVYVMCYTTCYTGFSVHMCLIHEIRPWYMSCSSEWSSEWVSEWVSGLAYSEYGDDMRPLSAM